MSSVSARQSNRRENDVKEGKGKLPPPDNCSHTSGFGFLEMPVAWARSGEALVDTNQVPCVRSAGHSELHRHVGLHPWGHQALVLASCGSVLTNRLRTASQQ